MQDSSSSATARAKSQWHIETLAAQSQFANPCCQIFPEETSVEALRPPARSAVAVGDARTQQRFSYGSSQQAGWDFESIAFIQVVLRGQV